MAVVRSSPFTDWNGVIQPRRLLIAALNKVAHVAVADLAETVFPFYREHALVLRSGRLYAETLTIVPKLHELIGQWVEKYHLGPPDWLAAAIEFTLRAWMTTEARPLLMHDPPATDSYVFDLIEGSQTEVLNAMRPHVTSFTSGEMTESDLLRLYGDMSMEYLRVALRRCETEMEQAALEELGPPVPKVRLEFTLGDAEAVVRHQMLGQSVEEITGGGRAQHWKERAAQVRGDTDPSNLRKMIQEFLRAVEIEPRRSLRSKQ